MPGWAGRDYWMTSRRSLLGLSITLDPATPSTTVAGETSDFSTSEPVPGPPLSPPFPTHPVQ